MLILKELRLIPPGAAADDPWTGIEEDDVK